MKEFLQTKGGKFVIVISFIAIIVISLLVFIILPRLMPNRFKDSNESAEAFLESTTETTGEPIEVEESSYVSNYESLPWEMEIFNNDTFVESDSEQIYDDFTNDGISVKYNDDVYLKSTLDVDEKRITDIIDMLWQKGMPTPYRIDSADQDTIYIIYNGRGYMFMSDGTQQNINTEVTDETESDTEYVIDTPPETIAEETEQGLPILEEPDVGLDAEDAFREEYGDMCEWVQEKVDGFRSSDIYIHPYEQTEDGEWLYQDSRDKVIYIVIYNSYGERSDIEQYN